MSKVKLGRDNDKEMIETIREVTDTADSGRCQPGVEGQGRSR